MNYCKITIFTFSLLLITLLASLMGCDRSSPAEKQVVTEQKLPATPAKPLRLVYANKVCYEPFIIAKAQNFFAEEGLNVEIKLVGGGIHAAEALVTGAADVAAMGDAPYVIAASRNTDVRLLTSYGGGSRMHRVISQRDITDIQQLQDARIGIQLGSSTHGAFVAWAKSVGLKSEKMHFISLRPLDMPQAMQTKQIDVIAGSEPWPSNVEALCGSQVHELTDFSSLGSTFPLVIASKSDIFEQRPEDIDSLLRALRKAVQFINDNHQETTSLAAASIGLPQAQQEKCTYQLSWHVGFTDKDRSSMQMTAQHLMDFGKIEKIPEI